MPFTAPSVYDLKARYPALAESDDGVAGAAIADAMLFVDDTWRISDQVPAIMALAAHFLSSEEATAKASSDGDVQSITVGDVTTSYGGKATASSQSFGSTAYGRLFQMLQGRNGAGSQFLLRA